jgi:hypothetical protein
VSAKEEMEELRREMGIKLDRARRRVQRAEGEREENRLSMESLCAKGTYLCLTYIMMNSDVGLQFRKPRANTPTSLSLLWMLWTILPILYHLSTMSFSRTGSDQRKHVI